MQQLMLDWSLLDDQQTYWKWIITHKGDQSCRFLADKHYSRQTVGATQFTRPGENLVLRTADGEALFVSWRSKHPRKDGYGYAYECTIFRNESPHKYLSSDLIKWAVHATVQEWGGFPGDGFITYVSPTAVKNENPGFCFEKANFIKQSQMSSRGLRCYKLEQLGYELMMEEQNNRSYLESCNEIIELGLESGEFIEVEWFLEEAHYTTDLLEMDKKRMKQEKLKGWSQYQNPMSWDDCFMPDYNKGWGIL